MSKILKVEKKKLRSFFCCCGGENVDDEDTEHYTLVGVDETAPQETVICDIGDHVEDVPKLVKDTVSLEPEVLWVMDASTKKYDLRHSCGDTKECIKNFSFEGLKLYIASQLATLDETMPCSTGVNSAVPGPESNTSGKNDVIVETTKCVRSVQSERTDFGQTERSNADHQKTDLADVLWRNELSKICGKAWSCNWNEYVDQPKVQLKKQSISKKKNIRRFEYNVKPDSVYSNLNTCTTRKKHYKRTPVRTPTHKESQMMSRNHFNQHCRVESMDVHADKSKCVEDVEMDELLIRTWESLTRNFSGVRHEMPSATQDFTRLESSSNSNLSELSAEEIFPVIRTRNSTFAIPFSTLSSSSEDETTSCSDTDEENDSSGMGSCFSIPLSPVSSKKYMDKRAFDKSYNMYLPTRFKRGCVKQKLAVPTRRYKSA